jgi:hypothetical protein
LGKIRTLPRRLHTESIEQREVTLHEIAAYADAFAYGSAILPPPEHGPTSISAASSIFAELISVMRAAYTELGSSGGSEGLDRLALSLGRAIVNWVGSGGDGDIELAVQLADDVLNSSFEKRDHDSRTTVVAFELLGDAHSLRREGDEVTNLEIAAKSYQACVRRIEDRASFARNPFLRNYPMSR